MKNLLLITLAKKLTTFHGKLATSEQARKWGSFAVLAALAALIGSLAQEPEYYGIKGKDGKITLHQTERNWNGELIGQNPMGIPAKQKPIAFWTPIGNIYFGGDGSSTKPVPVYKIIKKGDPDWDPKWASYHIERGNKPGLFWKDWEKLPEQETETVAVIQTSNVIDYLPAPIELFVENGGIPLPSGKVVMKHQVPQTIVNPTVPRRGSPEELAKHRQGATPERLEAFKKILPWEMRTRLWSEDYLVAPEETVAQTQGLFETMEEQAAGGWKPETNLWKFSLRPIFEKWGLQVKGSPAERASRPDLSCGVHAFQAALELLWSEKEGRPVKLSAAFLRWAHDQVGGRNLGVGTSVYFMANGIRKYGVCEEALMGIRETTPSQAALANAAQRKNLVTRQVGCVISTSPNLNENFNSAFPVVELMRGELNNGRPVLAFGKQLIPTEFRNPILSDSESRFLKEARKKGKWPAAGNGALTYPANGKGADHITLIIGYFAAMSGDAGTSPVLEGKQLPYWPKNQGYSYFLEFRQSFGPNGGDKGHYYMPSGKFFYAPTNSYFVSLGLN